MKITFYVMNRTVSEKNVAVRNNYCLILEHFSRYFVEASGFAELYSFNGNNLAKSVRSVLSHLVDLLNVTKAYRGQL
jgi:hypothetical protein